VSEIVSILVGTLFGAFVGFFVGRMKVWVVRAEKAAAAPILKERLRLKGINRHAKI
jgi:ABC-type microcin C transport system permease subunit YejE